MRRFNCANRSKLFTPAVYTNVTAKREMRDFVSEKELISLLRLMLFSGFTATAGLIFGGYKIGRYVEKSSKSKEVEKKLPNPDDYQQNLKKCDLSRFEIDSEGNYSRHTGLEQAEQKNAPKP